MKNSSLVTRKCCYPTPCLEPHPHVRNPISLSGTPSPCPEPLPYVCNPILMSRTPSTCLETLPHIRNPIPMLGTSPLVWNPPLVPTPCPQPHPMKNHHQRSPPPEKEIWVFLSFSSFPMFIQSHHTWVQSHLM